MANSSIKSSLQLLSFKMDKIDFEVKGTLGVLANQKDFELQENDFQISFRNPFRYIKEEMVTYVTGIKIVIYIKNKKKEQIATGTFIITGLFSAENFEEKTIEEKVVKYQAPAILFPYIRSCITNTLANAGFGSIILPLVDMNKIAQSIKLEIEDFPIKNEEVKLKNN